MPFMDREDIPLRQATRVTPLPTQPATHVYIHHGASGDPQNLEDEIALVRSYQNFHMDSRHWTDIAYGFLVGPTGDHMRFEGRGWGRQGGATGSPQDRYSYSICAIGNFETQPAPDGMIEAIAKQIRNGIAKGHIVADPEILGHKDKPYATSCPGKNLYAKLDDIRGLVADGGTVPPVVLPPITIEDRVANLERAVFGNGKVD